MNISKSLLNKHQACDCYVERHYMQRRGRLKSLNNALVEEGHASFRPALMCRTHGKWLKWLSESEALAIEEISNGV